VGGNLVEITEDWVADDTTDERTSFSSECWTRRQVP
jgi:hypothetical protein